MPTTTKKKLYFRDIEVDISRWKLIELTILGAFGYDAQAVPWARRIEVCRMYVLCCYWKRS
jgi:hypothetical protein